MKKHLLIISQYLNIRASMYLFYPLELFDYMDKSEIMISQNSFFHGKFDFKEKFNIVSIKVVINSNLSV